MLTIVIITSFLILLSPAYACIRMPTAKLAEECLINRYGTPSIQSDFENKTAIVERLQQYKNYSYPCGVIALTDSDIDTIADFLSNRYSVIRQTPDEYQIFLENANNVNNNLSTCDYYLAVANKNGWTGYVFNDESEKTVACANAPRALCGGGGPSNIIWNDLSPRPVTIGILVNLLNYWWLFIIVIIMISIGIFYKAKK